MESYLSFCKNHPIITAKICGSDFKYRHYINENSSETLVLLVGGIGLSDLIYSHFEKLAKVFSVITFDFPESYPTNELLTEAISELLKAKNIKAWFVGQSLGGFIAQIMAQKHPEVTQGLILSNTGCLSEDMSKAAFDSLLDMLKKTEKGKKMLKMAPIGMFKKTITKTILKKYASEYNEQEKLILKELCTIMEQIITKSYEMHMLNLLIDMINHKGMKKAEFNYLNDKVLLILSDDDKTFNDDVKQALVDIMPAPTLVTDLEGGHLSLMVNCDRYIEIVANFINEKAL